MIFFSPKMIYLLEGHRAVLLRPKLFSPWGHLAMSEDAARQSGHLGERYCCLYWVDSRKAANRPAVFRTIPTANNSQAQKISCAATAQPGERWIKTPQ